MLSSRHAWLGKTLSRWINELSFLWSKESSEKFDHFQVLDQVWVPPRYSIALRFLVEWMYQLSSYLALDRPIIEVTCCPASHMDTRIMLGMKQWVGLIGMPNTARNLVWGRNLESSLFNLTNVFQPIHCWRGLSVLADSPQGSKGPASLAPSSEALALHRHTESNFVQTKNMPILLEQSCPKFALRRSV